MNHAMGDPFLTNHVTDTNALGGGVQLTIREALFDLYGRAYQVQGSNVVWRLGVYSVEGELLRNLAPPPYDTTGGNTTSVGSPLATNKLASCDLSTLENGVYDLRLSLVSAYIATNHTIRFQLESNLKIGQFSFSRQDLVIPVAGIPLTVVRTYSTLNPKRGDFGYGWIMSINDLDVQLDEERESAEGWPLYEEEEPSESFSQRMGGGRNVTLTLPDGRRTTFAFYFEGPMSCGSGYDNYCFKARWQSAPGVHWGLEAQGPDTLNTVLDVWGPGQPYWTGGDQRLPMDSFDFPGFVLTNLDGTKYYIDREFEGEYLVMGQGGTNYYGVRAMGKPRLSRIVQRSGDTIHIGRDYIYHTDPINGITRQIAFARNDRGLISSVTDPNGLAVSGHPALRYEYDSRDNLIRVLQLVDRSAGTYLTNAFAYTNYNHPHYITGIIDARGIPVTRNLYDDNGRLIGIVDAAGRTNVLGHDIASRIETHYDRSGVPTTYAYDPLGNVTNIVNAYSTNSFTYDDNGAMTSHVNPLGHVTRYTNDPSGNLLSVTLPYPQGADPAAYTTHYTWNEAGEQTSVRLPTGAVITNVFDPNGNLVAVKDGQGNLISGATYNDLGLPATESDAFGSLSYAYNAMGNLIHMTNTLQQVVTSGYDENGNLTSMVDDGVTNTIAYDAMNRETSADYGHDISVNYDYEDEGEWSAVHGPTLGHMERRMDAQGRLAGWETVNGGNPGFAYDVNGRLEFETNSIGVVRHSTYNLVGWLVASTNLATSAGTTYGYDAAGQRMAVTNALGFGTWYGYWPSGSLKVMTNAFGTNSWIYSDAAGACSGCGAAASVTDPLGGSPKVSLRLTVCRCQQFGGLTIW
ncbi:MAG TPA: DUF6531 domain-containing protein [Clostridia bacterium]|nr:DUF6531 domain-containing protein [Clostridia bacterium]